MTQMSCGRFCLYSVSLFSFLHTFRQNRVATNCIMYILQIKLGTLCSVMFSINTSTIAEGSHMGEFICAVTN